jgi:hypothetical protein
MAAAFSESDSPLDCSAVTAAASAGCPEAAASAVGSGAEEWFGFGADILPMVSEAVVRVIDLFGRCVICDCESTEAAWLPKLAEREWRPKLGYQHDQLNGFWLGIAVAFRRLST